MRIEPRGPANGLACVLDDEIEAGKAAFEQARERLHARREAQIEPVNLEPIAPRGEVALPRVTARRIVRKTRRHDDTRTRTEKQDRRLVSNFDAPTGHERHAAAEIGRLHAFIVIQGRTWG